MIQMISTSTESKGPVKITIRIQSKDIHLDLFLLNIFILHVEIIMTYDSLQPFVNTVN